MTLTVMCGVPNAGKTTKATALAEETGATRISVDDYRHYIRYDGKPMTVIDAALTDAREALERGEDVIFDNVNSNAHARRHVLDMCRMDGLRTVCIYMDTPVETCLERAHGSWPAAFYAHKVTRPTEDEGFDEIIICTDGRGTEAE